MIKIMIKKMTLLFLIFSMTCSGMENFHRLEEKKMYWETALGMASFAKFEVSYKGDGTKLDGKSGRLISAAPSLGFYRKLHGGGYVFRDRYMLVQFDPMAHWILLPESVRQVLESVRINNGAIRANITMHSWLQADRQARESRLVFVLFHEWVGEVMNKLENFKIDLPMGIFEPDGVENYTESKFSSVVNEAYARKSGISKNSKSGIPFGRLGTQTVHRHGGYSPDNARFVITAGRDLATFWSVSVYPGNKHAMVTFHILVNSEEIGDVILFQVIKLEDTLKNVLRGLHDKVLPVIPNQEDKNALYKAIYTIRNLIGGTYSSGIYKTDLVSKLQDLTQDLMHVKVLLEK